jgi:hypothetical protein
MLKPQIYDVHIILKVLISLLIILLKSTRTKPLTCLKSVTNFYHITLYRVHLARAGFEPSTLVVIGTDCIGSYKSNYHTITITTVRH